MKNVSRIDKARFVGKINKNDDGTLSGTAVVARAGILTYFENGKTIRELVRPEELAKADSMVTLKMKPVTLDHPSVKLVTPETFKSVSVGLTGENVNCDDGLLYSSMTINDSTAIQAVSGGKRELSCGYRCDLKEEPGTWQGERYDREQINRQYNHVAICDLGRAGGVASLRLDASDVYECGDPKYKKDILEEGSSDDVIGRNIAELIKAGHSKEQAAAIAYKKAGKKDSLDNNHSQRSRPMPVTIKIDGIDYPDQAPEVAKRIEKLDADLVATKASMAAVQTKLDTMTAERDATKTKLDTANAEIAAAPAKIMAAAKARADLVAQASAHLDKADVEKIDTLTDAQIKIAVANKAFPAAKDTIATVKIDNADAVNTWYTAALATLKNDSTNVAAAANRQAVNGNPRNDNENNPHIDSQEEWEAKQLKNDKKSNREQFLK